MTEHECKNTGGRIVAILFQPKEPKKLTDAQKYLQRKKEQDLKKSIKYNYKNNKHKKR